MTPESKEFDSKTKRILEQFENAAEYDFEDALTTCIAHARVFSILLGTLSENDADKIIENTAQLMKRESRRARSVEPE